MIELSQYFSGFCFLFLLRLATSRYSLCFRLFELLAVLLFLVAHDIVRVLLSDDVDVDVDVGRICQCHFRVCVACESDSRIKEIAKCFN